MNADTHDPNIDAAIGLAALVAEPFSLRREEKQARLLSGLSRLGQLHYDSCLEYRRIVDTLFCNPWAADSLAEMPWLPVRLFKHIDLRSIPPEKIARTLVSSGTSGSPSRIFLDAETAGTQTRALARIVLQFLGSKRLPMVIVDDQSFIKDRSRFNARAAGILGFSNFGRDHLYLLDQDMRPRWSALHDYLRIHRDTPILVFGFTFLVWQTLVEQARQDGVRLRLPEGSLLIHGGGWKKLENLRIDSEQFKARLLEQSGLSRVHNYYGMVEQVGAIYFECEHGHLHTPAFADVLVRDSTTLRPLPHGASGLIQVMSTLPTSYPGHSLLTEDIGTILGEDDCPCGRLGRYFSVSGRLPNVELRGCSDTRNTRAPI